MEIRYYICKIIGTGVDGDYFRPTFADLEPRIPKWTVFDLRAIGNEAIGFFLVKVEAIAEDHIRIKKMADVVEIGKNLDDVVENKTKINEILQKTIAGLQVREICRSIAELNPNLKKEVKVWGEI